MKPDWLCDGSGGQAEDVRYHEGTCPVCLTRQPLIALTLDIADHRENVPGA